MDSAAARVRRSPPRGATGDGRESVACFEDRISTSADLGECLNLKIPIRRWQELLISGHSSYVSALEEESDKDLLVLVVAQFQHLLRA